MVPYCEVRPRTDPPKSAKSFGDVWHGFAEGVQKGDQRNEEGLPFKFQVVLEALKARVKGSEAQAARICGMLAETGGWPNQAGQGGLKGSRT